MKKYLLCFIFIFMSSLAYCNEVKWFKATKFSIKTSTTDWSKWYPVNIDVRIDFYKNKITILSEEVQIYKIVSSGENTFDDRGNSIDFDFMDQDGNRGEIRFRIQHDGVMQMYIYFSNVYWVYVLNTI